MLGLYCVPHLYLLLVFVYPLLYFYLTPILYPYSLYPYPLYPSFTHIYTLRILVPISFIPIHHPYTYTCTHQHPYTYTPYTLTYTLTPILTPLLHPSTPTPILTPIHHPYTHTSPLHPYITLTPILAPIHHPYTHTHTHPSLHPPITMFFIIEQSDLLPHQQHRPASSKKHTNPVLIAATTPPPKSTKVSNYLSVSKLKYLEYGNILIVKGVLMDYEVAYLRNRYDGVIERGKIGRGVLRRPCHVVRSMRCAECGAEMAGAVGDVMGEMGDAVGEMGGAVTDSNSKSNGKSNGKAGSNSKAGNTPNSICTSKGAHRVPWARTVQNGVKFSWHPLLTMFSAGNITERMRMGSIKCTNEVIVDLCCGIGYFLIPLLVNNPSCTGIACELSDVSTEALLKNIGDNGLSGRVTVCGDNGKYRHVYEGRGDRVLMGYLPSSKGFLELGMCALKDYGMIHCHEVLGKEDVGGYYESVREKIVGMFDGCELVHVENVKSYAVRKYHYVFDIRVGKRK